MRHLTIGRSALFALIAALVVIASITGMGNAGADEHDRNTNRVRIVAQRIADGRIEFALLQATAQWQTAQLELNWSGSRILPAKRFFPAEPAHSGWHRASWQTLTSGDGTEFVVRIVARRLDAAIIEFGLQANGQTAPYLPDSRFFPANTAVGRWLRSSEINLNNVRDPVPANVPVRTGEVVLRSGNLDGYAWNGLEPTLYYGTEDDPLDDTLFTGVVARAKTDDDLYDTIRLQAACFPSGEYGVQFWEDGLPYDGGDPISVRYRINDGEVVSESWWASRDGDAVFTSADFERAIAGADKLVVRMSFYSRTLTATFTGLRAMWNTPVQPNLDYCGRY